MCPGLIEMGSKTAEKKNSAQTNRQTDRHYENNGHLAVNQKTKHMYNVFHTVLGFNAMLYFTLHSSVRQWTFAESVVDP